MAKKVESNQSAENQMGGMQQNNKKKKEDGKSSSLTARRENGKIWSHIRNKWLNETPEETVRQEYRILATR